MSELKVASCYEFEKVLRGKSNKLFYPKSEVDAAIAELKSENERLNRELEHVKNGDCINTCDVVEKHVKEEIKAKRALWLARAERAKTTQLLLKNAINHLESKYKHRFDNMRLQFHVWGVVKRKCRAKAEEYK